MVCALPASADSLLDRGRALERTGQHAEAIAAFEAYLKTSPDDAATAYAELGFAALQHKDYAKALAATTEAIDRSPKPSFQGDPTARVRAAALYNLGLIHEAQGEHADAVAAYRESLAARSSRAIREHLQTLDRSAGAVSDPLAPTPLPGPFATLDAACRDWLVRHGEPADLTWGEHGSCAALDRMAIGGRTGRAAPFEDVVAFQMFDRSSLDLGVLTRDGWFLFEYPGKGHRSQMHCGGTQFTVTRGAVIARAGVRQLELTYHSAGDCFHRAADWSWDERGTIVIGVGASARPSAPPALITSQVETITGGGHATDATVVLGWQRDGSLDITGSVRHPLLGKGTLDPEDLDGENLLGRHLLAFP
jgi:hypothetical protein